MPSKYLVELFIEGEWEFYSDHRCIDYAEIMREVKSTSVPARVTLDKVIIINEDGEFINGENKS